MKKIIKNVWTDSVCSKVIAAGIIALIVYLSTLIFDWIPGFLTFLSSVLDFFLMKTLIPNWSIALLSLCALIVIYRFVINLWYSLFPSKPSWTDYKSDIFYDLKWVWDYDFEGQIFNLYSLCKHCNFEINLVDEREYPGSRTIWTQYNCESCSKTAGPFQGSNRKIIADVRRRIRQKIRTATYQS